MIRRAAPAAAAACWLAAALCALPLLVGCDGQLADLAGDRRGESARTSPQTATAGSSASGPAAAVATNLLNHLPPREADKIRIASYNIQVLGLSKESKPNVMAVLAETIRQFDVVAIQEIRAKDQQLMPRFLELINQGGRAYSFLIGPRLGRTSSKEQYAFVYDTARLVVDERATQTVDDPDDLLHREPFIARFIFRGLPLGEGFSFTLINMHTDPDEAEDEVDVLDDVFLSARFDGRYEEDVILLGDLNVDYQRLGQLGGVPGIQCTVHGQPTNTLGTRSYDNLVFDPAATSEYTGRAGVLDVQAAFGLTLEQAQEVSDHRPVWAEFSVYERRAASLAAGPR